MASRDLVHSVLPAIGIPSTAVAGNVVVTGSAVDTRDFASCTLIAAVHARVDGTYTFKLQDADESAPGSGTPGAFADVDPSLYLAPGGPTAAGGGGVAPAGVAAIGRFGIGIRDYRRFVRPVCTTTAVTTGGTIAGDMLLGHPTHRGAAV